MTTIFYDIYPKAQDAIWIFASVLYLYDILDRKSWVYTAAGIEYYEVS